MVISLEQRFYEFILGTLLSDLPFVTNFKIA